MKNLLFLLLLVVSVRGEDFFTIEKIAWHKKAPQKGPVVYQEDQLPNRNRKLTEKEKTFAPCLEVQIKVKEQTKASTISFKAYFYDQDNNLLQTVSNLALADRGKSKVFACPIFLPKDTVEPVYFVVPEKLLDQQWKAVVVFGDNAGAAAKIYPSSENLSSIDYPEKVLVETAKEIERKPALDPLIEQVMKTGNPKQPQITLFLRPPPGMKDASEAKGVLAYCVLAQNVEELKRKLQGLDSGAELSGLLRFAQQQNLLMLCWGSTRLWNPGKNWDEQSKEVTKAMDESFDDVARAWSKGVDELSKKYGFPNRNFLLAGHCGAAQYVCRLALRKPEYFHAIYIHIPGSFDQPTPEANRILWCLTTGEVYGGYERSRHFYKECRKLGYPMVYKAFIGLGHSGSPDAEKLGQCFFKYALTVQEKRDAYEQELKESGIKTLEKPVPWLDSFREPPFVGDYLNQEVVPWEKREMVPAGFQVSLPTKEIADTWNK